MVFRDWFNGGDAGFEAGSSIKEAGKFAIDEKNSSFENRLSSFVTSFTNDKQKRL
ncbi:MAG: hypothetical protein KAX39_01910 [candidate division Zixibacteria bacterium]|nr:hypothetical protein [candidate division Zixibacteria bacterium]